MAKKKSDPKKIILILFLVVIVAAIVILQNPFSESEEITGELQDSEHTGLTIGEQAPDFALLDIDGHVVQLSNSRGKATVVNFWASWCPPCREEFPAFEAIFQEHKDNLEIIGVNLQESDDAVTKFLSETPASFTIVLDPGKEIKELYNVFTQPVTYFIDEDGIIVDKKFGPLTENEIEEKFGKLGID